MIWDIYDEEEEQIIEADAKRNEEGEMNDYGLSYGWSGHDRHRAHDITVYSYHQTRDTSTSSYGM